MVVHKAAIDLADTADVGVRRVRLLKMALLQISLSNSEKFCVPLHRKLTWPDLIQTRETAAAACEMITMLWVRAKHPHIIGVIPKILLYRCRQADHHIL